MISLSKLVYWKYRRDMRRLISLHKSLFIDNASNYPGLKWVKDDRGTVFAIDPSEKSPVQLELDFNNP